MAGCSCPLAHPVAHPAPAQHPAGGRALLSRRRHPPARPPKRTRPSLASTTNASPGRSRCWATSGVAVTRWRGSLKSGSPKLLRPAPSAACSACRARRPDLCMHMPEPGWGTHQASLVPHMLIHTHVLAAGQRELKQKRALASAGDWRHAASLLRQRRPCAATAACASCSPRHRQPAGGAAAAGVHNHPPAARKVHAPACQPMGRRTYFGIWLADRARHSVQAGRCRDRRPTGPLQGSGAHQEPRQQLRMQRSSAQRSRAQRTRALHPLPLRRQVGLVVLGEAQRRPAAAQHSARVASVRSVQHVACGSRGSTTSREGQRNEWLGVWSLESRACSVLRKTTSRIWEEQHN